MTSVSIQPDGKIVAGYDNGDTKILGQIVVATFANLAGLEKAGQNLYSATLNSGEFDGIGPGRNGRWWFVRTGLCRDVQCRPCRSVHGYDYNTERFSG